MSQYDFRLEVLENAVDALKRLGGDHDTLSRDLHRDADAIQSVGGNSWIVEQVHHAAWLLSEHPDRVRGMSNDLRGRIDILHSLSDIWQGTERNFAVHGKGILSAGIGELESVGLAAFRAVDPVLASSVQVASLIAGAVATSKGINTHLAANKAGQAADAKAKQAPKAEKPILGAVPTGSIKKAASLADVPFLSQLDGTVYTDATGKKVATGTGGNNCGPTAVAMVIDHFASVAPHTATISALEAANRIRGGAQNNYVEHNHGEYTNFGLDQSATGTASAALLGEHGLGLTQISSVDGLSDVQKSLTAGHPVIVNVNATAYADQKPYAAGIDAPTAHIVVVVGYDAEHVYLNDPLASKGNLAVPVEEFRKAATSVAGQDGWYGASVSPTAVK